MRILGLLAAMHMFSYSTPIYGTSVNYNGSRRSQSKRPHFKAVLKRRKANKTARKQRKH